MAHVQRKPVNRRVLFQVALVVLLAVAGYLLLYSTDLVGKATVTEGAVCENGKFYLSDADGDGAFDGLELCNCVGSSCAKGSCQGAECRTTRQIIIDPDPNNQGGKVTVNGQLYTTRTVLDPAPAVGTRLDITVNSEEQISTPGTFLAFAGWEDESTTLSRQIVVTKDATYTPRWNLVRRQHLLSVFRAGTGTGVVTSSPGINCGADCSEEVASDSVVTLTAQPIPGSVFAGWSGDCVGESHICQVTMTAAKSVTATFTTTPYTLTLTKRGSGSGTITSLSEGINCGSDCSEGYSFGARTTLTATADVNSVFAGWSGPCGGTGSCMVSMIEARSVSATFAPQNMQTETGSYTLTVSKTGSGSGTISGATCVGTSCGTFGAGTLLTLTAAPSSGSVFTGWSEPSCGTSLTCTLVMDMPKSVTASFATSPIKLTAETSAGTVVATLLGSGQDSPCIFTHDQASSIIECVFPVNALSSLWPPYGETRDYLLKAERRDALDSLNDWRMVSLFVETTSSSGEVASTPLNEQLCPANSISCSRAFRSMWGFQSLRVIARAVPRSVQLSTSITGAGSVVSAPQGINCDSDCMEVYDRGTRVTLTATPGSDSVFIGWSGDACVGSQNPTCTVDMTTAKSVRAQFGAGYRLNLLFAGLGSGIVTSTSTPDQASQFSCTSGCSVSYPIGTTVTLTSTAHSGYKFTGWSNACTGVSECVITMDGTKQLSATFVPRYMLTVAVNGVGTVTSGDPNPPTIADINCGGGNNQCTKEYSEGSTVTLTANPPSTSIFTGWSSPSGNPCRGTTPGLSCTFDMRASQSVTAQFSSAFPLTVSVPNTGAGIVTSNPTGINCNGPTDTRSCSLCDCAKSYPEGTIVTLTAAPATTWGYLFTGWSGDACAGSFELTCTATMDAEKRVTAGFAYRRTLTVGFGGSQKGRVVSNPPGINCMSDGITTTGTCSAGFGEGTQIVLTAESVDGSKFSNWSPCNYYGDAISGTGGTICTTKRIDVDRTIWAIFN